MCIENRFRAYLAALDGTPKDFSTVENLFEELYHPKFVLEEDGRTVDRDEIKRFHAKAFELGSKATLLNVSACSSAVEFKFRLTNGEWDIIIHNVATVKDNKMIQAQSVEETKPIFLINFLAYVAAFDGTPKDFSAVAHLFEEVYHDDYVYQAGGKLFDRKQVKQIEGKVLELGSKATLLFFKDTGSDSIEFKFRMVNEKIDHIVHNVGRVKGNKLVISNPIDQLSLESVSETLEVIDACDRAKMCSNTIERKSLMESEEDNLAINASQ